MVFKVELQIESIDRRSALSKENSGMEGKTHRLPSRTPDQKHRRHSEFLITRRFFQ